MPTAAWTSDRLATELTWYSYRPGWALTVFDHPWDGPTLRVVARVEDSYRPGSMIDLGIDSLIPPMFSSEQFETWLAWRLIRVESHECREWLKKDGKPVFNPHPET
jgi:hypothetical protein